MSGYDVAAWSDFAVGLAGATAALTGLLFVGVSINLAKILALPTLPRLAATTLTLFGTVLLGSVFVLIPGQGTTTLGVELAVLGLVTGVPLLWAQTQPPRRTEHTPLFDWLATRLAPAVLVPALTVVSGITLALTTGGGLYWFAGAAAVAIGAGLIGAWILLVEIQR